MLGLIKSTSLNAISSSVLVLWLCWWNKHTHNYALGALLILCWICLRTYEWVVSAYVCESACVRHCVLDRVLTAVRICAPLQLLQPRPNQHPTHPSPSPPDVWVRLPTATVGQQFLFICSLPSLPHPINSIICVFFQASLGQSPCWQTEGSGEQPSTAASSSLL